MHVLVLAYSAFENKKFRNILNILNKSHIPPHQGKFLPLLSFG